jgi:MFS transporter, FHS family, L-fucose permease
MAGGAPISSNTTSNYDPSKNYSLPMAIMTALFFMIGFITVLNDVLIPSLKGLFELQGWQAMLIQFCFFTAYFVMSPPAGLIINKVGYKKGLMIGLAITALGLFLFIPAASVVSYGLFLFALFTVGSGFAIIQVAINPYIPMLGAPETASSRLNLGGAFNSVATFIGPIIGGWLILSVDYSSLIQGLEGEVLTDTLNHAKAASVRFPYIILAFVTILIAGLLAFIKLPQITGESVDEDATGSHLDFKHLKFGAGAIFFYVGTEVAIGSLLILYLQDPSMGALKEEFGSALLAYYWGGAMVGRFLGFIILKKIKAEIGLRTVSAIAFALVLFSMFSITIDSTMDLSVLRMLNDKFTGDFSIGFETIQIPVAAFLLVLVGLCNSIMWPSIFPLGIRGLGQHTSKGSGLMVSMVLGGAIVPLVQSVLATGIRINNDTEYLLGFGGVGYRFSFIVCLICYAYIFMFAFKWYKSGKVASLYNK